jgi:hypothetical protein
LNAFYYVLPVAVAWCLGFLFRTFLAGFFMVLLMRRVGASTAGSLVAALLFAYSGFITVWQGQAMSDAAIWLPLICYSVVRLHEDRSAVSAVIAAAAFAMPVLAGHPETAAHLTITGSALAVVLAFLRPDSKLPRRTIAHLALFGGAGLLAVGLAATQIVPTLEWLKEMNRNLDVRWPPAPLWGVLGFVSRDILRPINSFGLQIPEHAAYVGMFAFVVFPIALLSSRRRYVVFFALLAGVAFCVAYGMEPISELSYRIPVVKGFKNHRSILLVIFGVAALAGLGVSALEGIRVQDYKSRMRAATFAVPGFVLGALLVYALRLHVAWVIEPSRFPRVSFLLLASSAALVAWRLLGGLQGARFSCLAVGLVLLDVCSFAYGAVPFEKPARVFPEHEIFTRLSPKSPEPFRLAQVGEAYTANAELAYGIPSTIGYEILLHRTVKFITGAALDAGDAVLMDAKLLLEAKDRRIDMLSTRYLAVSQREKASREFHNHPERFRFLFEQGKTDVFENLTVLPPALLVPSAGIVVEPDEDRQLELIKSSSFDPQRSVVLAQQKSRNPAQGPPGAVSWISRENSTLKLKVDNPQESILVLSQTFYPGWKAFVDGNETDVFPANFGLTGIVVGPGAHEIVFSFSPASFKWGLLLSVLALASSGILGFRASSGNRARGAGTFDKGY